MNKIIVGRTLLFSGLITWMGLMLYIVFANLAQGEKPSVAMAVITLSAWAVFFVGKTLTRAKEDHAHRDA